MTTQQGAVWSLLLASGYLKATEIEFVESSGKFYYTLELTNKEVRIMFAAMVQDWFANYNSGYHSFLKAFLQGDLEAMNAYMSRITLTTFSYFDTGTHPAGPERTGEILSRLCAGADGISGGGLYRNIQ